MSVGPISGFKRSSFGSKYDAESKKLHSDPSTVPQNFSQIE